MEANIAMIGSLQAQVASLQTRLAKKNEEIAAMAKTNLFGGGGGGDGEEGMTKGTELRMKQIEADLLQLREQNETLQNAKVSHFTFTLHTHHHLQYTCTPSHCCMHVNT